MASTTAQAQIDEMLDVYIHDYLVKRKLHNSAKSFMTAAKVSPDPIAIDAPEGFLYEWWSVFWDIYISRTNDKHSESASAYIQAQQTKAREQQLQMQQSQLMRHRSAQLKRRHPNHPALGDSINGMNSEGMTHSNSMDSEASPTLIYTNRMALHKSATSPKGQLVLGNSGNMSTALEKMQAWPSGLNQGNTSLPLKGLPRTGIDQLRPSLGVPVQKPNLTNQNQSLLVSQQQQALEQDEAQNNLGNSTKCDIDPHRLSDLGRGSLSAKDGQAARKDGSTFQAKQTKAREQQLQMQHCSAQLMRRHPNHPALGDPINGMNSEGMTHSNSMDSEASPTLIYANRMALPKPATSHQGHLVHCNSGNMSTALEQIQAWPSGFNQGNTSLPRKGSPLTGIDQLRPSLGVQVQKPNLMNQNQSLLVSQQQQALSQAQAQNNLGISTKCDMDPHRLPDLGRRSLSTKDGQAARNDGSTFQAHQTKPREQQLQMQQLQLMQHRSAQLKRRHPNHSTLGDSINGMNSKGMTHSNSMDSGASPTLVYANRAALPKSVKSHLGQLVHGNSGNMSTALEEIQTRPLGLNQGNTSLPLKDLPLTEIDQLRPSLGVQVQKPNLTNQNQSLLVRQQQQALAQAQAQAQAPINPGNSTKCDMDPHRLSDLGRGSLSAKDGQAARNDGSICTQVLSGSPKTKMAQAQHSLSQQQEPLQQNNRKRKQHSSSGAANSTGTGNAVSPSPNSPPSTPSHRDGIDTTSSMQHVDSVQVSMMMNGIEGTGSLASSSLSLDHLELFGDFDFLDKQFGDVDVESFLLNDGEDSGNLDGTIEQCHPVEQQKETSKGSS